MTRLANRILRATSLVVTDRRWAGPLSAMALGFGVFIGVAIGPSATGTLAGVPQIIEIPSFSGGANEVGEGGGGSSSLAGPGSGLASGGRALSALPVPAPLAPPSSEPQPAAKEPEPASDGEETPEGEEDAQLEGTVVHANPAAGSYTLAIRGGELVSVHAVKLPAPGAKLSLMGRPLANNTFAEAKAPTKKGRATRATFRGVVTFTDPDPADLAYTVSGRGASIPIHIRPDPTGAPPALPAIGSYATVTVDIEKPGADVPPASPSPPDPTALAPASPKCAPDPNGQPKAFVPAAILWQHQIEVEGVPSTYLDLAATLTAVCADSGQLLLSADSTRESGHDLLLIVPKRIDLAGLALGDSLLATATVEPDGTLTLAGIASDERTKGADDPTTAQGDLRRREA